MSQEELGYEQRIAVDPHDVDAWEDLVAMPTLPADKRRATFEKMLSLFPLAHKQWVKYMEFESNEAKLAGDVQQQRVKDLLKRLLKTSFSVEISQFYLQWLEDQHASEDFDKKRQLITDAYEEVLQNVGLAIDSYPIWQMYVDFLQRMPEVEAYDLSLKLVAMRKVYNRAIVIAMRDVDVLFKQYLQFERKHQQQQQTQQLEDHKEHVNASLVMKEREAYWRHLDISPNALLPTRRTSNQVDLWFKMLQYELTNPENLKPFQFKQRMRLSFRRAVSVCWFHLEIWFAFFEFERNTDDYQAAAAVLRLCLVALPKSSLARLSLADLLETNGLVPEAKQEYEHLLQQCSSNDLSTMFIQFMRFSLRQFGLKASRDVFRRARAQEDCTTEVYVAMASLELLKGNLLVAKQVYELAMKRFPRDAALAGEFLHFMQYTVLDYTATKQAFERVCETFDEDIVAAAKDASANEVLYSFYIQYQSFERDSNRDVGEMIQLEQRILKRFPARANKLQLALHRYTPGLPLAPEQLVLLHEEDMLEDTQQHRYNRASGSRSSAAATASAPTKQQHLKDMAKVPPFLRKLAGIVPKKMQGMVDVDLVIRNLTQGSLPLAPLAASSSSATAYGEQAVVSRKRQMGVDGAPVDAFKQRKERKLG